MEQEPRVRRLCQICRDWKARDGRRTVLCFGCFRFEREGRGETGAAGASTDPANALLPSLRPGAHRSAPSERQRAHRQVLLANLEERHWSATTSTIDVTH